LLGFVTLVAEFTRLPRGYLYSLVFADTLASLYPCVYMRMCVLNACNLQRAVARDRSPTRDSPVSCDYIMRLYHIHSPLYRFLYL